jgi:hypothetical protein
MNHPTGMAWSLFVAGLLAGACNQNLAPPPPPPSGGASQGLGGAGTGGFRDLGTGGKAGLGGNDNSGAGGTVVCTGQSAGCVSSCTTAPFVYVAPACVDGTWTCPSGSVSLSTCDPNSCAQLYQDCCDDVTGEITPAPCSSYGQVLACPNPLRNVHRYCIPAILGISSCTGLNRTPCALDGQRCYSGGSPCTCKMTPDSGAGLAWDCPPFIP